MEDIWWQEFTDKFAEMAGTVQDYNILHSEQISLRKKKVYT